VSGTPPLPLSVLVTTRDEEETIGACLRSVAGLAEELVVVDSGSTDRTLALALGHGARILEHPYESPARQKNWAIPQCRHPWVLILDADEQVSPALAAELRALFAAGGPAAPGSWIPRENRFLGRVMKHGGWGTDRVIRLIARDTARYDDRLVHEEIDLPGPLPALAAPLLHDTFRSFPQYVPKAWRWAEAGAREAHRRGRQASAFTVFSRPIARFVRAYVLKRGFLDGGPGLVLAGFTAMTVYMKYARLWELTRAGGEAIDARTGSGGTAGPRA